MLTAIDLFAGLGGWTEGARLAGARVVWAANHWPAAVAWHAANHPGAVHICQDLHQADWTRVPRHDVLLASPACQGHARARGVERPHHDACRSTAWAVVSAAECHRPPVLVVENVPEFTGWRLYPAWCAALEALGYALSENIIDAADCGLAQNRVRVFVVGVRARCPLVLQRPEATPTPAARIIDYGAGPWSPVAKPGRAAATIARWRAGLAEHGDRFVFSYYGSTRGGRPLSRPLGTITTRDRWAVVDGDRMRMLSVAEARAAMGFRGTYRLPENKRLAMHLLGNAVCPPVAAYVIGQIARAA